MMVMNITEQDHAVALRRRIGLAVGQKRRVVGLCAPLLPGLLGGEIDESVLKPVEMR